MSGRAPLLDHLVHAALGAVRGAQLLEDVRRVSGFDRYQASAGLEATAELVAGLAADRGLSDVVVDRHDRLQATRWWSFEAPLPWTPTAARLAVEEPGGIVVDHEEQPCALATYSASAATGGEVLPLRQWPEDGASGVRGAVAVVDPAEFRRGTAVAALAAAGARGFVTATGARSHEVSGRIELPLRSTLFAFSVTDRQLGWLTAAARRGADAEVHVAVDRAATMPVVSGVLPGEVDEEVWVTGHLCHPRPGANDNASGVAAVLGAAQLLAGLGERGTVRPRRTLRFLWGPEFVGSAATLHRRLRGGAHGGRLPVAVVNLDMVGEDQDLCRSPFVVERPPDPTSSDLTAVTEHVVDAVFAATASAPGWWVPSAFQGFSDHALFADPSIDRPAVQFCHPDDVFNHSGADAPDKVSPVEMARSTVAGALAAALAADAPVALDRGALVAAWAAAERERLDRVAEAGGAPWAARLRARAERRLGALKAGSPLPALREPRRGPGSGLAARWEGPLNVRGMLAAVPGETARRVTDLVAADKRNLSVLFALAVHADGHRDDDALIAEASFALERPLDPTAARVLLAALTTSGWLA